MSRIINKRGVFFSWVNLSTKGFPVLSRNCFHIQHLPALASCVLELLKPFVGYVLLSPTPPPELLLLGKCLHSELLSVAGRLHRQDLVVAGSCGTGLSIMELLVRIVPLQPSQNDQQLLTLVSMVEALVHWLCQFQDSLETSGV